MINKPSLLSQIKSKYILQNVLILAYPDIKSVFKLVKYNKNLLNKLDISIKDCYNYKIEKFLYKASDKFPAILYLKATYAAMIIRGERHTIANAGKPAFTNSYMARPNKRKSKSALPPVSCVYVAMSFVIYLA